MITGQIKNQIDQIWDTFWTGGITNSLTILEQMTYLFFMKMLDDSQIHKEELAAMAEEKVENPTFTDGNWTNPETGKEVPMKSLRWSNFKDYEPQQLFDHVRGDVFSFIKHLSSGSDSAYSRFMENAIFLIQSPRTLVKVVDGINSLDMNNRDTMGDTYEYILGKMAASGNNGQFRTPRHIIRMMVELMRPTLDDVVCDPAMGSAGFIVETAKYIAENYKAQLYKKANDEHFRNHMFHGFDTDQTMLRIGAMNLKLHKVDNPDIAYRDSLSSDNTDTDRYTLILANPPFAGSLDNESVAKNLLSIAKTKKTELLFLSLFLRSLQTGGRCASIVPDGVLTGSSKAHKDIRKAIVDDNILEAVISMPSGVFQPYSGVSTAILIFKKTGSGGTDKVWFYDMKADGYSLDQKRTEVAENDIPEIIARYNNLTAEADRKRTDQSFLVPVDEIREHGYDLAFNTYRETVREVVEYDAPEVILGRIAALNEQFNNTFAHLTQLISSDNEHNWVYKKFGDLCDIVRGGSPRPIQDYLTEDENGLNWIKIGDVAPGSKYITSTKEKIKPEGLKKTRQVEKGDFILSNSMSFGRPYILKIDGCIHDGWLAIKGVNAYFIPDFLFYYLSSPTTYALFEKLVKGGVVSNLNSDLVKGIYVPIPPKETQERIVSELDDINSMIEAKREQLKQLDLLAQSVFYTTFGDPVTNPKGWEVRQLKNVCSDITDGDHSAPPKSKDGIPFITISNIDKDNNRIDFTDSFFVPESYFDALKDNRKPKIGDVLYTVTGSYGITVLINSTKLFCFQRHIGLLRPIDSLINSTFLAYWGRNESIKSYADNVATGIAQKTVSLNSLRVFPIIVPPLDLQNQFAAQVEAIEAQKAKVEATIAELQTLLDSRMDYWFN